MAGFPWVRRDARQIRLWSGIVLFTFAFTHFLNAGMGLFGAKTADLVQLYIGGFWHFPLIAWGLFFCFVTHAVLGLKRIAWRRNWRLPAHEWLQIVLALMIPLWLVRHIVAIRATIAATDSIPDYGTIYLNLWSPIAIEQSLLLLFVWGHGCIGIYTMMRLKPWFARWRDLALAFFIVVPVFALSGFLAGMREASLLHPEGPTVLAAQAEAFQQYYSAGQFVLLGVMAIAGLAIAVRHARMRLKAGLTVRYVDGPTLKVAQGATLLEISRNARVPHASVCGGKARCSTCRVRILEGNEQQPDPDQAERRLLARIAAPASVRLACQLIPTGDILVQRLVEAGDAVPHDLLQDDPFRWGVERKITLLFADIRGFTTIAEHNFAFDIVFVLNRFLTTMSSEIEANGGRVDKYLGDGLMAIFGADATGDSGARNAVLAAKAMQDALKGLNEEFLPLLNAEIRIGIGLHTGQAILGRIGAGKSAAALTALGDTVNIAARLEEMTKSLGAICVLSEITLAAAGLQPDDLEVHEMAVRGRTRALRVHAIRDFSKITFSLPTA